MIDDLSRTLKAILSRAPAPLSNAQVVFSRPADAFTPPQTAIDLFLYDIRENVDLRNNEPVITRNRNGQVITHRQPIRLACSYVVTAWPVGQSGDDAILLEQKLLGQALQMFTSQPTIDPSLLHGSLQGQEPPLPLVTALVDPQKIMPEFWTALGGKLRPSLTVSVTISVPAITPAETTAIVAKRKINLGERTSSHEEEINPATLQSLTRIGIGGLITDASRAPVPGASVTLRELNLQTTTDLEGRYKLSLQNPGKYTLVVKKDQKVKKVRIAVQAGKQFNVQLR